MGKSAGAAPNFQGLAGQQGQDSQTNVNTQTQQNRPDINTPFGTQSWTTGPDGQPVLNSGFSGPLAGGAAGAAQQAGDALSNPLDPSLFGPVMDGNAAREQAINASYGASTSRLDPRFEQGENRLRSRLMAQGLDPNSEAGRTANDQFGRDKNDAYGQAMNQAILAGDQASNTVFGQNLASHQQQLSDALRRRGQPLQDVLALSGLSNQMPGFNTAGQAQTAPWLQAGMAQGDYNLQNARDQNNMWGSIAGSLGGLLKAPFSFL